MGHFSKFGTRLFLGLCIAAPLGGAAACRAGATTEPDEVKMSIDDVPAKVKATILTAVGDGTLKGVDKDSEDGKTTYEADAKIDKKDYEIKVSEDGTLVSKKLDDEDNEKGDKKD
jgi:hypothetical protein